MAEIREYEAFARTEALRRGIDPDVAVIVWNAEGGLTEPARRGTFPTGSSWWAPQLHYGGPGYERFGTTAGMGNTFTALTGWQPGDPAAWKDAMRYALDAVARGGWGPWYGAAARGIRDFDGVDRTRNWPGTPADEWDYRSRRVRFDAGYPAIAQNDPWSCSCTSARWALMALGRRPSERWIEDTMLAEGVVSREAGLLDATGAGLADFLRRHYGEFGYDANHEAVVSWAWACAEGQRSDGSGHGYPLLLGGRGWNHWTAVRDYDPGSNQLVLMNPAPGWMGIDQTMDEATFNALGPFSAVRVWHPDLLGEAPPAPAPAPPAPAPAPEPEIDPRDARIAELEGIVSEYERQVTDKDARLAEVVSLLGYARGDLANRLAGVLDDLRQLEPKIGT